ncbi:hypothetical protein BV22DRAFT_1065892 [Leucogyrophana mollusca]|uniref:Uncharacterized protein n=1 Tax=Leucogyrophana mollusca TaxID=85980 RepID=A0ACB8BI20_9AGAM|nr:hypothetical protein BV22DRAFT_1065892 [Leucogyrophana mollusca]
MGQQDQPEELVMRFPAFSFSLVATASAFASSSRPKFGGRLGKIILKRQHPLTEDGSAEGSDPPVKQTTEHIIDLDTPNFLSTTSRGVVPHLSRDHCNSMSALRWVHIPFESFLDHTPPVPTLQCGPNPLHTFLGFSTSKQLLSLSLRDPLDAREMPPNGNTYVSANCIRGVRKVTLADWHKYTLATRPDLVFALSDIPFTPLPHSQKRITKSIERSAGWLAEFLRPHKTVTNSAPTHPLNILVQMPGGTSAAAREAFARGLTETLHDREAEAVKPLRCLDDGVAGYAFDLVTLRAGPGPADDPVINPSANQLDAPTEVAEIKEASTLLQDSNLLAGIPTPSTVCAQELITVAAPPLSASALSTLLRSSLAPLPPTKPRLVTGSCSPHEVLELIRDVGVDVFDSGWAVSAASAGVALDFVFPVPSEGLNAKNGRLRLSGRRDLGHNIYDTEYAHDFARLAGSFAASSDKSTALPVCPCFACSPPSSSSHILHSSVDEQSYSPGGEGDLGKAKATIQPPVTRAYVHHLLHTHEMSAHTLLVAHNLAVLDAFFAGVRRVLSHQTADGASEGQTALPLPDEITRFLDAYDRNMLVFDEAKHAWLDVDRARGKGRLAREKGKESDGGSIEGSQ